MTRLLKRFCVQVVGLEQEEACIGEAVLHRARPVTSVGADVIDDFDSCALSLETCQRDTKLSRLNLTAHAALDLRRAFQESDDRSLDHTLNHVTRACHLT